MNGRTKFARERVSKRMKALGAILIGIVLSSVLLLLCLPLGEQWFLAPIALVPLLMTTKNRGFVPGFLAAITCLMLAAWIASKGWLYGSDPFQEGEAWLYTICGTFGFSVAFAVAFAADKKIGQKPIWWLASIALLFEALLLFELPGHLALSQYRNPLMLAIASVGSVWAVSFLTWWSNLWISRLDLRKEGWMAVIPVAAFLVGHWIPFLGGNGPPIRVAALQAPSESEDVILRLHSEAASQKAELVVWPEFAGILFMKGEDTSGLQKASRLAALATSFPIAADPLPHNTSSIFDAGVESDRYVKRKLFGAETKMHTPGTKAVQADFRGRKVGLGICYDSCFPFITREAARGASMISLPTNDPPSPYGFLAAMHSAYTPFRAAETGVPIVRADSLAYSMVVAPGGRIVSEAGLGEALLVSDVATRSWTPPAMFIGDGVLYLAGVLVLIGFRKKKD